MKEVRATVLEMNPKDRPDVLALVTNVREKQRLLIRAQADLRNSIQVARIATQRWPEERELFEQLAEREATLQGLQHPESSDNV